jgi:hypothetical protein
MKYAAKIFSMLLIQMLLFGNSVQCAGDPAPDTLSPQVNIGYGQFQQGVSAYIEQQSSAQALPLSADEKPVPGFNSFLKKKAGDVCLFALLSTDNQGLRDLACKALVKLKDTRNIYRLCFFGIEKEAMLKNGTRNKRAQDALIKLYLINNAESKPQLLPLKRMLFKIFLQVERSARSRVVELLMLLPMTGDKDREYIIPWIKTGNMLLFSKALTWINELGDERLDTLWGKSVLDTLVAASSSQNMLKAVFLNMINVMEKLGAEEEQITEVCCNVLKKNLNTVVVCREASLRLGRVKSGKCKIMALDALINYGLNDKLNIARFGAIKALGMLGEAIAIPALEARLAVVRLQKEAEVEVEVAEGKRWQDIATVAKKESVLLEETIAKLKEIKEQDVVQAFSALARPLINYCDSSPQVNGEMTMLAERSI